jgi:drug/metabolite transporter, DME family
VSGQTRAVLAVLVAAALFGTSATTLALLAPDAPGPSVAAMRLLVGAAGLVLVVVALRGGGRDLLSLWRQPVIWLMGAAVAGYQALFFMGTVRAGVAVGTLVSLAVAPFLAGVLGWILREGPPGWTWVVSTVIAVAGVVLLVSSNLDVEEPVGMLFALGAGACYAVYTVIGVRLARAGRSPSVVLAASFSIGAVLLLPAAVTSTWWFSRDGVVAVLWLGLVATTGAYLLFGLGLKRLQPGHIATLNLFEPVVATILGVVVLGEQLGMAGWTGTVLVIAALALLGIADRRAPRGTDPIPALERSP